MYILLGLWRKSVAKHGLDYIVLVGLADDMASLGKSHTWCFPRNIYFDLL